MTVDVHRRWLYGNREGRWALLDAPDPHVPRVLLPMGGEPTLTRLGDPAQLVAWLAENMAARGSYPSTAAVHRELAEKLGVSAALVGRYVRFESDPKITVYPALVQEVVTRVRDDGWPALDAAVHLGETWAARHSHEEPPDAPQAVQPGDPGWPLVHAPSSVRKTGTTTGLAVR